MGKSYEFDPFGHFLQSEESIFNGQHYYFIKIDSAKSSIYPTGKHLYRRTKARDCSEQGRISNNSVVFPDGAISRVEIAFEHMFEIPQKA